MKEKRYQNKDILTKPRKGFVRRSLQPGPMRIIAGGIGITLAMLSGIVFIEELGVNTLLSMVVAIAMVFGVCLLLHLDQISDIVFTREYEKAILAGAAGSDVEFLMIFKQNHSVTYYNPSCHQYFTYSVPGKKGGLDTFLSSMEIKDNTKEELFAAITARRKVRLSLMMKNIAGENHRINLHLQPIERPKGYFVLKATKYMPRGAEEGRTVNIDIQASDVTETLDGVIDEMPIGVYKAREDGTLLNVNHKLAQVLGYKPNELVNQKASFRDIIFGEHLESGSFNQRYDGFIAFKTKDGKSVRMELRQIIVEGEKKPEYYRFGFVVRADDKQKNTKKSSNVTTSTSQKTDFSFEEGGVEKVWHHFVEDSPIAIALLDEDIKIVRHNGAFEDLVEKVGRPQDILSDMLNSVGKTELTALIREMTNVIQAERRAIHVRFADNEEVCASLFITPMGDSIEGLSYICYMIDTSDKNSLEQQFVQSQKMQAVGQLAGGIAHDFNNLLTAMIGFCDLLLTRYSPGDQSFADVMQIKQNANRAANLVRQLLAFSRKQTLQPEIVEVTDTLSEVANLIRRLIGENIDLKIRHARDLPTIKVDQGQLEQVLVNLCVNARDAMNGKGDLKIVTRNCTVNSEHPLDQKLISPNQDQHIADGNYVVIEVRDNGCGMDFDTQTKIFEPFFTTKDVGEGTGLGLATVYGIIQQTGGYVFVSSKEGVGTTFYIFLQHHSEDEGDFAEPQGLVELPKDLTGKGTVLLVEDEASVRMFGVRALKNKGYEVLEAEDGDLGLEMMKEHGDDVDLIITDVMMPGTTGPEMVEQILKDYPKVKVVFISGYGEDAFVTSYGADREFDFLPKPFTLNQLAAKVKDVLG